MNEGIGEFLKLAPGVEWLIEKPLRLAVLYEMATRAMKNPDRVCFMSKWEYKKFSLKRSQKNQIERVLRDLETGQERAAYVQRTGRKDNESGAVEYRLVDNIYIDTSKTSKKAQQAAYGPGTGQERAETKEKSRYNKKEIYKEKSLELKSNQSYEEPESTLQSSAKVSQLCQQVIDLGKKMGVELEITTRFQVIEEQFPASQVLRVAEAMFAWISDNPKKRPSTARLLTFLRSDRGISKPSYQYPEYTTDRRKQLEIRGATYVSKSTMSSVSDFTNKFPELGLQKEIQKWASSSEAALPDDLALRVARLAAGPTKRFCENLIAKKNSLIKTT